MCEIVDIGKWERKTTRCIICKKRLNGGTICRKCESRFLPRENSAIAVCKNCDATHILRKNLTDAHPNVRALEFIGYQSERHIYEIEFCKTCDPHFQKRTFAFRRLVPIEKK